MIYVFLIFVIIALIDIRPLFKNGQKRDAAIVCICFVFTLAVCMLTASGIKMPSPMMGISELMHRIGLSYPPLE